MFDAEPYRIDTASGLIDAVPFHPSPNHDRRPEGVEPTLLVIHGISLPAGRFGGPYVEDLFLNRLDVSAHESFAALAELRVSSHVFVRRDGAVVQFVPFTQRAWHAGASSFQGRTACNDFSIGIELEGTDETPYEEAQYVCLNALIAALRAAYPAITPASIVGHEDIAPGRKTDPGPAFDWGRVSGKVARPSRGEGVCARG